MSDRVEIEGLQVDQRLADFVNDRALPGAGVEPGVFLIADDVMWDYEVEGHAIVQTKLQGYIALGLYIALMVLPYFLFKKLPVLPETTSGK